MAGHTPPPHPRRSAPRKSPVTNPTARPDRMSGQTSRRPPQSVQRPANRISRTPGRNENQQSSKWFALPLGIGFGALVILVIVVAAFRRTNVEQDAATASNPAPAQSGNKSASSSGSASSAANPANPAPSPPGSTRASSAKNRIAALENKASQGSAQSQVELGRIYYLGTDAPQDLYLAKNWFEKAADQNYPEACYLLAQMNFAGQGGFTKNDAAGITGLEKAASLDYVPALLELGEIHQQGLRGARSTGRQLTSIFKRHQGSVHPRDGLSWQHLKKCNRTSWMRPEA